MNMKMVLTAAAMIATTIAGGHTAGNALEQVVTDNITLQSHSTGDWSGCRHEDGSGQRRCIWDARHMGNGEGHSMIVQFGHPDEDSRYIRITHRRAKHLLGDNH
jgi:hypothetical protein